MKSKILILFVLFTQMLFSQGTNLQVKCNTAEANKNYFQNSPNAYREYLEFNKNIKYAKGIFNKTGVEEVYVIPVVFHVYGNDFNGKAVTESLIENALIELNKDFKGLNDDFNTVNSMFTNIRGTLNIEFKLARKDPDGNPTNGIVNHITRNGYGNSSMETEIAGDAWDNYKYMNIYIQNDLYDDGVTNNSGVAWYPSTEMSDNNTARIVYNGAYLGTNTNKEFAATLTHEFGHWLNLAHTFDGGCTGTDYVDDTPQEDGNHDIKCSLGTNCDGVYVNHENYMGYNGATGCYKMFTQGQIERVVASLEHPARRPLWQEQNLIDTGVKISIADNLAPVVEITAPLTNTNFEEKTAVTLTTSVTDPNGISDINRVEFYFNETLVKTIQYPPYNHTFTNLTIGNHKLKVTAFDTNELSDFKELDITVFKKINYPEVRWITSTSSYTQNNIEFATGDLSRRIEIIAYTDTHEIIVKGPNNFEATYTTKIGEAIIINNASEGTWVIEIPSEGKKITKTF